MCFISLSLLSHTFPKRLLGVPQTRIRELAGWLITASTVVRLYSLTSRMDVTPALCIHVIILPV